MNTAPRIAAFFDLDRTLITVNSGALWLRQERREGRLSLWQMLQASFYLAAYQFHAVDMDQVMDRALSTVRGEQEQSLRELTHAWFERDVRATEAPGARAALQAHRDQGHLCVLLTASSLYESEAASAHFELDGFLCTRYEVEDGRMTGRAQRPLCYGAGKVHFAEGFAAEHGVDLDGSYFYTDSITDLPMLERVGHPRIVQPDPRLRRLARQRAWPVLDWSVPGNGQPAGGNP